MIFGVEKFVDNFAPVDFVRRKLVRNEVFFFAVIQEI